MYWKVIPMLKSANRLFEMNDISCILYSCPTQSQVEGWDAMKPLCWRSVNNKAAGRPCHMHHHRGDHEMNEMSFEKFWNEINGREKLEKLREKPTRTSFRPPRNPHGVIETRTSNLSGGTIFHEKSICS